MSGIGCGRDPAAPLPLPSAPPPRGRLAAYGLTPEDYEAIWLAQGGACAVCSRRFGWNRPACIDHDHGTGETYGLLCRRCNRDLLGVFGRDPDLYFRAMAFLEQPPVRRALHGRRFHRDAPPAALVGAGDESMERVDPDTGAGDCGA